MSARVRLTITKSHRWHRPAGVKIYYDKCWCLGPAQVELTGRYIPLWEYPWQRAGFGYGRFGYKSFGWAQGGLSSGGFGYGKFGEGEFGYYNGVFEWTSRESYKDGQYTFGAALVGTNNQFGPSIATRTFLIRSIPDPPRLIRLEGLTEGTAQVSWTGSADLMEG